MDNYTGKLLGNRYLLEKKIGEGGMAVVYKALDNVDNKTVAVKILKEEFSADDSFRRRFKNESRAVALLSHQNIVKVYDVSFGERVQYIVMEYIEGITLKQYIQEKGALSWRESVIFATQILRALQHAHEKGVVHRDIKPQNIMLLKDNRTIKVADFGIASFLNKGETRTMTEGAIGSVHYISPEQAKGEIVDNKTDIYSAGVVIYEMLTGRVPFQSDSAVSVAIMQLQKEAIRPRKINPSIPLGIEQITMRAMNKRPIQRYQTAAEMLLDLDEFRRNPGIRFDHSYFSDNDQTRFIPAVGRRNTFASGKPLGTETVPKREYARTTVITPEYDEDDYENELIANKNYTLPILVSIIFFLVIVIIGIAWFFFTNVDEVTVPEFVGQYIKEIRDDNEYKYFFEQGLIEENLVYTTEYDDGYIFYQSEEAGKKMQISSTSSSIIKLNIAYTSESMTIPEFGAETKLQEARSILQKMGFTIKTKAVVDSDVPESSVIRTEPEAGQNVAYGSTVTIFYAIDDAGKIAVPRVIGEKLADAKAELDSLGFTVTVKTRESSAEDAGIVLEQSVAPDTTVIADNTEITIYVGTTSTKTASVEITLPDIQDAEDIYESVYVYVGETLYKTYDNVKLDGSTHTVEIGGNEKTEFSIIIGEQVVCSGDIDFTADEPEAENMTVTEYTVDAAETTAPETTTMATTEPSVYTIPDYKDKEYFDYYTQLVNIGFDNINKIDKASDTVPEGYVISVSADKTEFKKDELATAEIRIFVSTGPAVEE